MTICIIDYGSGNLHSVLKAFDLQAQKHERRAKLTSDPAALSAASHIVLPGVGAFGDCVAGLKALPGMWEALNEAVLEQKKPFFGICVGMQMMLERGLEHGEHEGLGWIGGQVVALGSRDAVRPIARSSSATQGKTLKIPHMGWNTLEITQAHPVLSQLQQGDHAYFVHSFHAQCANSEHVLAISDYGGPITACIGRDHLIGTQFHPEKSGEVGLRMIEQFILWDGSAA